MVVYKIMGDKHDFTEFQHAKKVTEDFPSLIYVISKLIPALEEKAHYTAVAHLLNAANDAKLMMEMQYDYYKNIYQNRGKRDD